ncbi:hypothetical protein [Streptomyces sp. YGL11-2]|uniref:hypothetical protein n=1 Tax=Streptomyces sp. YGL11-2 TaxID=3414028 RepID=UPI003CF00D64
MAVLDRLWREVEARTHSEGYVVEIIGGKVIIDPFTRACTLYEGSGADGYAKSTPFAYGDVVETDLADGRTFAVDTSGFPGETGR